MKLEEEIRDILSCRFDNEEEKIQKLKKLFIGKCASIFDAGAETKKPNKSKMDWKYKCIGDYLEKSGII